MVYTFTHRKVYPGSVPLIHTGRYTRVVYTAIHREVYPGVILRYTQKVYPGVIP